MGNEASNFVKVRRTSKESLKDVKIFGDCKENRYKSFLYLKYSNFRRFSDSIFSKARRSVSHSRLSNGVTRNSPPSKKGVPDSVASSRKSSGKMIKIAWSTPDRYMLFISSKQLVFLLFVCFLGRVSKLRSNIVIIWVRNGFYFLWSS